MKAAYIFSFSILALLGCKGQETKGQTGFEEMRADQVMFGVQYDIKDMGTLRARLLADTAFVWEDSAKALFKPVKLDLYDDNGRRTAHLTSKEGVLYSEKNEMVAIGNVVLTSVENERQILTEELFYNGASGELWSNVRSVMIDKEGRVEGTGFRTNREMTDVEVFGSTGRDLEVEF